MSRRFHWPALLSGLVTVTGALSSPAVLAVVSAKTAAAIVVVGAVLQSLTKPLPKEVDDATR